MRIQCTSCRTTAKLSDDKEGAKVRCPSCGHVYVARPAGAHGSARTQSSSTKPIIFGGAGLLAVILLMFVMPGGERDETARIDTLPDLVEDFETVDLTGWDSPLVGVARSIHKSAFQRDRIRLQRLLAMDRIYARMETTDEREVISGDWGVLANDKQILFEEELINSMIDGAVDNLVATWKPFDGLVLLETDEAATVRITLEPRNTELGVQTRNIEWQLVNVDGRWKAWSWERWISPEERRGELAARVSSTSKVTLSDGSKVLESEPGPLDWVVGTTAEERAQIEKLIATVCSPDTRGGDLFSARQDLIAICRPAVPALLTKFYELDLAGFENYENQTASMQLHKVLTEITGYVTTFKAHEALGATDERRSSGVKQWFSWYHRKFKRFKCETEAAPENVEEEELLFEPRTEQERRDYERALREAGNN